MIPSTLIAIKLRAMGDTVLFTASLQALKDRFPRAQIHAVVAEPWAPLLQHHPAVQRVWPLRRPAHRAARAKALALLSFKLRRLAPEGVLNAHASPSSALLAFATGARVRAIHFHGLRDANRFSTVAIPGKGEVRPALQRDRDAAEALMTGLGAGPSDFTNRSFSTRVVITPEEAAVAARWTEERNISGPLLSISTGASRPAKRWDLASFLRVAEIWMHSTGGHVLWLLGPGEHLPPHPATHHQLQNAPIRKMAALLARSDVWLGNDSGPKHLAIALGRPTVTLMGPEDPFEWHPYDRERHPYFYIPDLTCRNAAPPGLPPWCGLETCTIEGHKCMKGIDPQRVAQTCLERWERNRM